MNQYSVQTIAETTPAAAGTAASVGMFQNLKRYSRFTVDAALVGATGGALDVYLQRDVAGTWVDWIHFAQLVPGAAALRVTFDTDKVSESAVTAVGAGSSPALAAGDVACPHPGDKVRALFVAGALTSAGAAISISLTGHKA